MGGGHQMLLVGVQRWIIQRRTDVAAVACVAGLLPGLPELAGGVSAGGVAGASFP